MPRSQSQTSKSSSSSTKSRRDAPTAKSTKSDRSNSISRLSKSKTTTRIPDNAWDPMPWFTDDQPENPKNDKHCLIFLGELWDFLQEAKNRGFVNGQLHPNIQRFLDVYGANMMYSVNNSADRLSKNDAIWSTLLKNGTMVFPDGVADMLNLCLSHLTLRIKGMRKQRTVDEQTYDEVFACPLLAILQLITKPGADARLSKLCIQSCYPWLLAYLSAIPHKCKASECDCLKAAGPIEDLIETAVLPGAAKYCPDVTFLKPMFLSDLIKTYKNVISFNFVLALSLLYMKGRHRDVAQFFEKIVNDLDILLRGNKDMVRSVLMVRTGVGEYVAQGQCSDYVLVCLDMILSKFAKDNPQLFNRKAVDVVESFFVKQRPMSATLAFNILCTIAENRSDLVEGRKARYVKAAEEMQLPDTEMRKLQKFP